MDRRHPQKHESINEPTNASSIQLIVVKLWHGHDLVIVLIAATILITLIATVVINEKYASINGNFP